MLTLVCSIVGEKGSAFAVEIEENKLVDALKDAIKQKNEKTITCDARELQLYLGKQSDNRWLDSSSEDVKRLKKGKKTDIIEALTDKDNELQGEFGLQKVLKDMPPPSTEQIHILVVVPKEAGKLKSEDNLISLLGDKISRNLVLHLQKNPIQSSENHNSFSNGVLGKLEQERLREDNLMIDVDADGDEEAFWSQDIQIQAASIEKEDVFIAFITPFFIEILKSFGMIFVNSEKYAWLSQSPRVDKKTNLAPDGFATHQGMFCSKPVPNDGVLREIEREGVKVYFFGEPVKELYDCLILFEGKLDINNVAFGQVIRYLRFLMPKGPASAILFDRTSFWLIKSHDGHISKVIVGMWADNGSKALFRNFINKNKSPWVSRMTLSSLCVNVNAVPGDSYLGCGSHGRVFKVTRNDEIFALKIVEKSSTKRLFNEMHALKRAHHTGLTATLVGEIIETPQSAALLLSPVGKCLSDIKTQQEVRSLFVLLQQLHEFDLVHGDPRVPNVILYEERLLWIDLVDVLEANPTLKQFDADILTRSILKVPLSFELDMTVVQLIENYGNNSTRENIDNLANAVCEIMNLLN